MRSFIIALLCCFQSMALAQQLTTANASFPPWRVIESNGQLSGIDVDILKQLSIRLQLPLVTKGCGWKRCLKHMEVGESDVMTGLYKTPEREQYMEFVEPPIRNAHGTCFYLNKARLIEINSYQDLQKLTVGVIKKVSYFKQFDNDSNINKLLATTGEGLFRLLEAQRIDVVAMECVAGDIAIKDETDKSKFQRAGFVHRINRPVYLAISKKSPLLTREKELSQALQSMLDNGEIKNIMLNYGIISID